MYIQELRRISEQLSPSDARCLGAVAELLYERGRKLELVRAAIPPQGEADIEMARQALYG
jgi:hypothetical protein